MDLCADVWPGGTDFNTNVEMGQNEEEWEDWLRWDPAVEPTSPEGETFNSGSSKNDSPIPDPILPPTEQLTPGQKYILFGRWHGKWAGLL